VGAGRPAAASVGVGALAFTGASPTRPEAVRDPDANNPVGIFEDHGDFFGGQGTINVACRSPDGRRIACVTCQLIP
jgi:hypothetical protein